MSATDRTLHPDGMPAALPGARKALVLHHWDADGISSAAILVKRLESKGTSVASAIPTIGNWYLEKDEIATLARAKPDLVVIADLGMQQRDLDRLVEGFKVPVWLFDHHKTGKLEGIVHVNPLAYGASGDDWPSASLVISRWLGREDDILTFLGVAGDVEDKAMRLPVFPSLEQAIAKSNLSFPDLRRLAALLDAPHRVGDKEGAEQAVRILADGDPAKVIDANEGWAKALAKADELIYEALKGKLEEPMPGVILLRLDTPATIVSPVARRLAVKHPDKVVVVANFGYNPKYDTTYVRTAREDVDMAPLIADARGWAHSAGGKREVAGIIVEKGQFPKLIERLKYHLEGKR